MKDSMGEALRRGLVHDLRKNVDFEVVPFDTDMIITGTIVETLRHLDREVFATGQRLRQRTLLREKSHEEGSRDGIQIERPRHYARGDPERDPAFGCHAGDRSGDTVHGTGWRRSAGKRDTA